MNNITDYLKIDVDCTGCGACTYVCQKNAISLQKQKNGYNVAVVDSGCVGCAQCVKLCPQINLNKGNSPNKVYAGYAINKEDIEIYTSGGAATILGENFIRELGGQVCGVVWDSNDKQACYRLTDDSTYVTNFRGSKYVESNARCIYPQIAYSLNNNKPVLFIGTPCQVAAVKNLFNSDLLYTIDLVCHGVPPEVYLKEYLNKFQFEKTINNIQFRGEHDFYMTFTDKSGNVIYKLPKYCDLYFTAFLEGITYRENCYNCKYANVNRVGDLTLGDFWGLESKNLKQPHNGRISLILENTERGKALMDIIKNEFYTEERSIEEAVKENRQLSAPTETNKDRNIFINKYVQCGFNKALKYTGIYKTVKTNKRRYMINLYKHKIKLFLKGKVK